MRIVVPVVQEVVGRGGVEKPLRDTQLELLGVLGEICPLVIGKRMAPFQNGGNHRIETRKSIPIDLWTVLVGTAAKSILVLFKEQKTVCAAMLRSRNAKRHNPR